MSADEKLEHVKDLCLKLGIISYCEYHSDDNILVNEIYLDSYGIMNEIQKHHPESLNKFKDENELLEFIDAVMDDVYGECPYCQNVQPSS